jgi:hypothetical protein
MDEQMCYQKRKRQTTVQNQILTLLYQIEYGLQVVLIDRRRILLRVIQLIPNFSIDFSTLRKSISKWSIWYLRETYPLHCIEMNVTFFFVVVSLSTSTGGGANTTSSTPSTPSMIHFYFVFLCDELVIFLSFNNYHE